MSDNGGKTVSSSMPGLLFIVFIVLKLVGVIDWKWLWVLAPLWMPFSIVVFCIIMYSVISFIVNSN